MRKSTKIFNIGALVGGIAGALSVASALIPMYLSAQRKLDQARLDYPEGAIIVRLPDEPHRTSNYRELSRVYGIRDNFGCKSVVFNGNISFEVSPHDFSAGGLIITDTTVIWNERADRNRSLIEFSPESRRILYDTVYSTLPEGLIDAPLYYPDKSSDGREPVEVPFSPMRDLLYNSNSGD